jgi:hypothetical protein
MSRHQRKQLLLALRAARTTRTHAYEALLAARTPALAARLERIHAEVCSIEAEVRKTLTEAREAA